MKLAVLGGGGVRSPFLAKYIASRAKHLGIDEIVFMDKDQEKLRIFGGLSKTVAGIVNPSLDFRVTDNPLGALRDADFIITSLRVGQDPSRVLDERIALQEGVLGQETTGAGGFAMALRSIPALIESCTIAKEVASPKATIFNFTNPSGLVTQALRNEGFHNVYGICDGPSGFFKEIGEVINRKVEDLSVECFGLNHLSWFRSIKVDGKEMINELIHDDCIFKDTEMRVFDRRLIERLGMLPNAYLYYYYHRENAIISILKAEKTRGEIIEEINRKMIDELKDLDPETKMDEMLRIYLYYYTIREKSYMAVEAGNGFVNVDRELLNINIFDNEYGAGYAGVALNFIEAMVHGIEKEMILSVPNNGAMEELRDDDVVEITCRVGKEGVKPMYMGKVPELQMALIKQVKLFERLAVKGIKDKSIDTAIDALMVHPLVNSYSIADRLVHQYLDTYQEYCGTWR